MGVFLCGFVKGLVVWCRESGKEVLDIGCEVGVLKW